MTIPVFYRRGNQTETEKYLVGSWSFLVFALGISGNTFILYSTVKHKAIKLNAMSIWTIQNLAVSDFLNSIISVLPASINALSGNIWVFGPVLCKINAVVNHVCVISNFYFINFLQFNKVYRRLFPLRSLVISRNSKLAVTVFTLFISECRTSTSV